MPTAKNLDCIWQFSLTRLAFASTLKNREFYAFEGVAMKKKHKHLMSIADAAGYVFAAPDDPPVTMADGPHLEQAFRNGHRAAAQKARRAVSKLVPSQALVVVKRTPQPMSWLHSALGQLKPRRLAA